MKIFERPQEQDLEASEPMQSEAPRAERNKTTDLNPRYEGYTRGDRAAVLRSNGTIETDWHFVGMNEYTGMITLSKEGVGMKDVSLDAFDEDQQAAAEASGRTPGVSMDNNATRREQLRTSILEDGSKSNTREKRVSAIESARNFEELYAIVNGFGGINGRYDIAPSIEHLRVLARRISNLNLSVEFNTEFNRVFEQAEGGLGGSDELLAARYKTHELLEKEHAKMPLNEKVRNLFRRDRGEHRDGYAE